MSTINQLSGIDAISAGDLVPVYDSSNGDARKASFTQVNTFIAAQSTGKQNAYVAQYEAPLTGATVQVADNSNNTWLILTPAGTLADLDIKFPALANCVMGQELLTNCTQILTAITWDGNGATVVGAPADASSANSRTAFKFDAVLNTWYRVG